MDPESLVRLLTSMTAAAAVVEAIDAPPLRERRGWNLRAWRWEFVPFGVRFLRQEGRQGVGAAVVAVVLPEAHREAITRSYARDSWPTTLLMLG